LFFDHSDRNLQNGEYFGIDQMFPTRPTRIDNATGVENEGAKYRRLKLPGSIVRFVLVSQPRISPQSFSHSRFIFPRFLFISEKKRKITREVQSWGKRTSLETSQRERNPRGSLLHIRSEETRVYREIIPLPIVY